MEINFSNLYGSGLPGFRDAVREDAQAIPLNKGDNLDGTAQRIIIHHTQGEVSVSVSFAKDTRHQARRHRTTEEKIRAELAARNVLLCASEVNQERGRNSFHKKAHRFGPDLFDLKSQKQRV